MKTVGNDKIKQKTQLVATNPGSIWKEKVP